ncbi:MAG TPA: hypothetical protein VL403_01980, partial [Candidatus Kryptonia bacterium]|nr:hypothetical protein [Candidatus Kryptonia bacterium]
VDSVIGNRYYGIGISTTGAVTISKSNIFGNGSYYNSASPNCGIRNNVVGVVSAKGNFWGSASGPGPDPADAADPFCEFNTGSIDSSSPATKRFP